MKTALHQSSRFTIEWSYCMNRIRIKLLVLFVVSCVCFGALVSGVFLYVRSYHKLTNPAVHEHTVTLTEHGFSPKEITIKEGDIVTFVSELGVPFWPASNLHPEHTLYPALDPEKPILPSEHWMFMFKDGGVFKYHDHLNPQQQGVVTVLSDWNIFPKKVVPCEELQDSEKMYCFDTTLEQYLRDDGIEAAFAYFKKIYAADPMVPSSCHAWAHRLGEVEYDLYTQGRDVVLQPEASFCSYGYFHGFITAMVAQTQRLESAQEFCEKTAAQNNTGFGGMQSVCVHGIGHSVATLMLESQEVWGDVSRVITRGTTECEQLYAHFLSPCLDGMFHELYGSMRRSDYGLGVEEYANSKDLFYYCRNLEGDAADSCFHESIPLWPYFLGNDKKVAMQQVLSEHATTLESSPRILHTFARSFIETDIVSGNFQDSVDACALVPDSLFDACIKGLAVGFITHGHPEKAYEQGFTFCTDYYEGVSRSLCLQKMMEEVVLHYSADQVAAACSLLPKEEYVSSCGEH
jgi:hypothetical protein